MGGGRERKGEGLLVGSLGELEESREGLVCVEMRLSFFEYICIYIYEDRWLE